MGKRTPLYACHIAANAKMVDFAGWEMPLHYGSQLQEHHTVRQHAGVFDVSHMTIVDLIGDKIQPFLRYLLANNIDRLQPSQALYTCMLNDQGGVIDDLIVYKISDQSFRLILNSATREKDLQWLQKHLAQYSLTLQVRDDLAMLAIQGPEVMANIPKLFAKADQNAIKSLKKFNAILSGNLFIARTGYTGEDGFEVILPANEAPAFWQTVLDAGIQPCGLGARDTLRLEAGLNLYGTDMDESVSPLESNLAWTVAFLPEDRDFIGRAALEKQTRAPLKYQLIGLVLEGPGVLRNHQKITVEGVGQGEITSGSYSPTLNRGIALARVPLSTKEKCLVEMRGGRYAEARVVKPPFVRQGKKTFLEKNGAVT